MRKERGKEYRKFVRSRMRRDGWKERKRKSGGYYFKVPINSIIIKEERTGWGGRDGGRQGRSKRQCGCGQGRTPIA